MQNEINDLAELGFTIVEKPKKAKPVEAAPNLVAAKQVDPVSNELVRTNQVIQRAISNIAEKLKTLDGTPKKLTCENIERDEQGFMTRFEINIIK